MTKSAFRNLVALKSIYRAGCQNEWGIGYYRDNLLTQKLPILRKLQAYIHTYSEYPRVGFYLSTGRRARPGSSSTRHSETVEFAVVVDQFGLKQHVSESTNKCGWWLDVIWLPEMTVRLLIYMFNRLSSLTMASSI